MCCYDRRGYDRRGDYCTLLFIEIILEFPNDIESRFLPIAVLLRSGDVSAKGDVIFFIGLASGD
jgi:hypothetical protein